MQGTKSQNLEVNGPVSAQEPITGCPQVSFMCPHRRDLPSLVGAVKQALIPLARDPLPSRSLWEGGFLTAGDLPHSSPVRSPAEIRTGMGLRWLGTGSNH